MNRRSISHSAAWAILLMAPASAMGQTLAAPSRITQSEQVRLRAQRPQRLQRAEDLFRIETTRHGLGAADVFEAKAAAEDVLGRLHVRYERKHRGLRVLGGDIKASLAHSGATLSLNRTRPRSVDPGSIEPAIAKQEAVDMLLRELRIDPAKAETKSELLIEAAERNGRRDRLSWLIRVETPGADSAYYLTDASTGEKFDSWTVDQYDDYEPRQGWGSGYYNNRVTLSTSINTSTGRYELVDPTRGNTRVIDMNDRTDGGGYGGERYSKSGGNDWGNGADWQPGDSTSGLTGQSVAVDAMYGGRITWDLLLNVFGRESYNGAGSPFRLRVHLRKHSDSLYNDAHWSTDCDCASFGDGAEPDSGHRAEFSTVAHELGHGLFNSGIGGDGNSGEKAGLNEGTGDILAAIANHYRVLANGEGSYVPDGPDVSLYRWRNVNPWAYKRGFGGYVATMPYEEEHVQGNVYARMFTILAAGAPSKTEYEQGPPCDLDDRSVFRCLISPVQQGVAGIGIHKASEIFYLATVAKMDSTPTFHEAREDWLDAAADLFGENSEEYRSVAIAFAAIQVGSAPADTRTPVLSMRRPLPNDAEQSLYVDVSSDDDIGVRSLEIRRGNFLMKSLSGGRFKGYLDLRSAAPGSYALRATGWDAMGKSGTVQAPEFTYRSANYLIQDGGFELDNGAWSASQGDDPISNNDDLAFLGNHYAAFKGDAWLRQRVRVPAGTTRLTLGFRVAVNRRLPPIAATSLAVEILNEAGTQVTDTVTSIDPLLDTSNPESNHYRPYSFNLSGYAGRTIWVRFRSTGPDSDYLSHRYRLDNVYLVYEGPIAAEFTAVVDEADQTVTFRVKNITGTNLVDRIEIGSPGAAGRRMPAVGPLVVATSEFAENITYNMTARLISATGARLAELGPVAVRVRPSHHRLENTGFEAGNGLFWNTTGNTMILTDVGQDSTRAYMGAKYARMGARGVLHVDTLYQRAILPGDLHSAKLSFRLRIESNDVSGDQLKVKILDHATGVNLKTLATISGNTETDFDENGEKNHRGYRQFTYNLTEFKGRIIRVLFEAAEDPGGMTTFYLDNATVVYSEGPGLAGN